MTEQRSEESIQYKIRGQRKAFIDKNLQIQIPGVESTHEKPHFQNYTQIYSHYSGVLNSHVFLPVNKHPLEQAMKEAQDAYQAWKKMQKDLSEKIRLLQSN
jgi:hypothetical protein